MPSKTPNQGGCWYCSTDDGEMYFCSEFDTNLHLSCLIERLESHDPTCEDGELECIAREFREALIKEGKQELLGKIGIII